MSEKRGSAPERTRLLTPSEIELWELSKKATPGPREADTEHGVVYFGEKDEFGDSACYDVWSENVADTEFVGAATPDRISSLLETLEKTREALASAQTLVDEWEKHDDENMVPLGVNCAREDLRDASHEWMERAASLLSGFSGEGDA